MVIREDRTGVDKKFFELCSQVVESVELKIYDMDYLPGSHELRLYIMNNETGTAVIEDCIMVDKALSPFIDEEEWMPSELTLEVSSPGVYRNLTTVDHFKSATGNFIQLNLKNKIDENGDVKLSKKVKNLKKVIVSLISANDDGIDIEIEDNKLSFKYNEIKRANLEIE